MRGFLPTDDRQIYKKGQRQTLLIGGDRTVFISRTIKVNHQLLKHNNKQMKSFNKRMNFLLFYKINKTYSIKFVIV
jgi:hypothetical protein